MGADRRRPECRSYPDIPWWTLAPHDEPPPNAYPRPPSRTSRSRAAIRCSSSSVSSTRLRRSVRSRFRVRQRAVGEVDRTLVEDGQREERPCRLAEHPALAHLDGAGDLGEEAVDVRREQVVLTGLPEAEAGRLELVVRHVVLAAEASPRPRLGLVRREGGGAPGVVHLRLGPPVLLEPGVELGPVGGTELGEPPHHPPAQVEVEREAVLDAVGQPPAKLVDVGVRGDHAPQGGKGQARGRIGGCEPGTERVVETTGHRVRVGAHRDQLARPGLQRAEGGVLVLHPETGLEHGSGCGGGEVGVVHAHLEGVPHGGAELGVGRARQQVRQCIDRDRVEHDRRPGLAPRVEDDRCLAEVDRRLVGLDRERLLRPAGAVPAGEVDRVVASYVLPGRGRTTHDAGVPVEPDLVHAGRAQPGARPRRQVTRAGVLPGREQVAHASRCRRRAGRSAAGHHPGTRRRRPVRRAGREPPSPSRS